MAWETGIPMAVGALDNKIAHKAANGPAYNSEAVWNRPKPMPTLEAVLAEWEKAKLALAEAKELEMEMRKKAFALGFGADAKEGTNAIPLANGYELKGVKKLNYKLKAPVGFTGDTVDAIDETIDKFRHISNEGGFIADRIFKWSVDMSIAEYRKLVEESEYEAPKKRMLEELNKVLEISEASPTLEIKAPKAKK